MIETIQSEGQNRDWKVITDSMNSVTIPNEHV